MSDPLETVTVEVGGEVYGLWSEIDLVFGAEQAVRTANLTCAHPGLAGIGRFRIRPDMPALVKASGETVITGYVRDVDPNHGDQNEKIRVTIGSKTIDSVESSVLHESGRVENADMLEIAAEIDPTGVEWILAGSKPPKEPWHQVVPSRSPFRELEELARSRGYLLHDNADGQMVLADRPEGRHAGALAIGQGGNIVRAESKLTGNGRHDKVVVRGQGSRRHGATELRAEATAHDGTVGRSRPQIILHEGEPSYARLKKRADNQVRRAAGRSRTASVEVAGWRDQAGRIWSPNWLVYLDDPLILLRQDMAISQVTLRQGPGLSEDAAATRAILQLVDPRAFGGDDTGGDSDAVWQTPDPEAEVTAE
ncbi:phage baseplate assembly protein [Afifella aestuarii]|uniref:phage baseplate assembly protein n=1 Tax=Afifella aestuarii TaxID=1909496 RepID=UPI000FE3643D|nr:hypothetical protein [Afifella aestuarii]